VTEAEIDAELLALYAVPPMMLGPVVPGRPCECGCTTRKRRSALTEIVDEFRLRWDPHWPDDWIPWQALVGLLVVAAVWLWNRGVR
jgi:hypothetical protein